MDGPFGGRRRLYGTYEAVVVDVTDPDNLGRVKVSFPWLTDEESFSCWARLSTLMAGGNRGTWFIPEVDEEVLVTFVHGDVRLPVVIGSIWNGVDRPPEEMDGAGDNNIRSITSRSGHKLTFDDTAQAEKVVVETQGGHTVTLDDAGGGTITIAHNNGATIEIDASGKICLTALSQLCVSAPLVKVDAPMSEFSGVVKCDTLVTNAVVSSSYTPGAGNVW